MKRVAMAEITRLLFLIQAVLCCLGERSGKGGGAQL